MRSINFSNSSCHHCRHCYNYQMTSRRNGHCQQLGVTVQGNWKVCPLFVSTFTSNCEAPEDSQIHIVLV